MMLPATADAHAFVQSYRLPLPTSLYLIAAGITLVVSFLLIGLLITSSSQERSWNKNIGESRPIRIGQKLKLPLQLLSVALLVLCIVSGFIGSRDPVRVFNMTFFWIIFSLGALYLTALFGNLYAALNPWQLIASALQRYIPWYGKNRYPTALSYSPALLLYVVFIWVELLGNTRPFSLSAWLLGYTALNMVAAGLLGVKPWFYYGELFSVMFRLVARIAPLNYRPNHTGAARWQLRLPFSGLLEKPPTQISLLLFLLFMLSSTAFDGLSETAVWFNLFWRDATGLLTPLLGEHPIYAYVRLRPWYFLYETIWLVISPLIYLAALWLFLWAGKRLASSRLSTRELMLKFAYSLLPIALVYHATHYYTLLFSQGVKIRAIISDPFGWNWDLFGTAYTMRRPIIPDMEMVWYSQVGLIVFGHVVSVYLAHKIALRVFPGRKAALLSQIPMLALMVLLTIVGLWILAQPLQGR